MPQMMFYFENRARSASLGCLGTKPPARSREEPQYAVGVYRLLMLSLLLWSVGVIVLVYGDVWRIDECSSRVTLCVYMVHFALLL